MQPRLAPPPDPPPRALYPRVFGDAWQRVPAAVRALFLPLPAGAAHTGRFDIRHGRSLLARILVRLMAMPAAGRDVPLVLGVVVAPRGREIWRRAFGPTVMRSTQYERAPGVLAEQLGPIECCFRLELEDGVVHFRTWSAAVRLGPLRIPLPRWLAPRIEATTRALASGQVRSDVAISVPLVGPLLAYAGEVEPHESARV